MSVVRRKLKRGWRYAYDKTLHGKRLWSPYIYLTRAEAERAEARAAQAYHENGLVIRHTGVKDLTLENLINEWLAWIKLHRSRRYFTEERTRMARALGPRPSHGG